MKIKVDTVWIGDLAYLFNIGIILLFAILSGRSLSPTTTTDDNDLFDTVWKEYGFCIKNRDVPYLTSHDVCMYVDVVLSVTAMLLYLALRNTSPKMTVANQLLWTNAPILFMHGIAHGVLGAKFRADTPYIPPSTFVDYDNPVDVGTVAVFYLALMKSATPNVSNTFVFLEAVFFFALGMWLVPSVLSFTYVTTIFLVVASVNQLVTRSHQEKQDVSYWVHPLVFGIPIAIAAWLESTQCKAFVQDQLYGHLLFDATIGIGAILEYLLCYYLNIAGVAAEADANNKATAASKVKRI